MNATGVDQHNYILTDENLFDERYDDATDDYAFSYSNSPNVIGIATKYEDSGHPYHVYQTNESGHLVWDKAFCTFQSAREYAAKMYRGRRAYFKAMLELAKRDQTRHRKKPQFATEWHFTFEKTALPPKVLEQLHPGIDTKEISGNNVAEDEEPKG